MNSQKPLCGFLNLLKPPGMSSSGAVCAVRKYLGGEKIGHGGTLDPEAAGVLPLSIGKATRLFDYLQNHEKAYIAELAFTGSTDTEDAQGSLLRECSRFPTEQEVKSVLPEFTGTLLQKPPMFSALKQEGERLYKLARSGKSLDLPAREVRVYALEYLASTERRGYLLGMQCSKGFYVRSLCRDIGIRLNAPSHMRFLLRTQSGSFTIEKSHTLEEIKAAAEKGTLSSLLIPPLDVLSALPRVRVPEQYRKAVFNGLPISWEQLLSWDCTGNIEGESPFVVLLWENEPLGIALRENDRMKIQTWIYQ